MTAGDPRLDEEFLSRSVRAGVEGAESKEYGGDKQGQQDGEREDEEIVAAAEGEGDREKDADAEPDLAEEEQEGGKSDVASASQTSRPQSVESDEAPVMKGVSYPGDEWIPRWDAD